MDISAGIALIRFCEDDQQFKILLGHPTNHSPNFWGIPKGRVDEDETFLDTAVREFYEETGFQIPRGEFRLYHVGTYRNKSKRLITYLATEEELIPFGIRDIDKFEFKCISTYTHRKTGEEFPEMDDFKWVDIVKAIDLVHHVQQDMLRQLCIELHQDIDLG